jgi:GNAT superfamily N-acetyltransferase
MLLKYSIFLESIELYHGTVYDFDKFNFSNIGTGTSKSVHGYGMYFTESEGVAKFYCDESSCGHKSKYIYHVNIFRDNFLDWDGDVDGDQAQTILNKYLRREQSESLIEDMEEVLGLKEGYRGSASVSSLYSYLESLFGSKKGASEFLDVCGFDGIKFESKENGFRTHNYVIFDINNIKILDKETIKEQFDKEPQVIDITIEDNDEEVGNVSGVIHYSEQYLKNWLESERFDTLDIQYILNKIKFPVAILKNINVYEEYRNQGFGKEGMSLFLEEVSEAKYVILLADTGEENNFELEKWYQGYGFKAYAQRRGLPLMILKNDE